jgi:hypothetical protein
MLFLNCRSREEFDGALGLRSRDVENGQASKVRAYSGVGAWSRIVKNCLMLLCCFSEALYPGLASHGTLTTLQHFYDEHFFRSKMVFRNLKKAMLDGDGREYSSKDAKPFLKPRSRDTKRVQNSSKKSLA